ncbi:MAG: FixH family protein [Acidibrevibacterium sp.]|uniref:FixH family protein n=1 Tax=Acidibrevibacterium sp. TaxID=2606776 RepID=UPI003D01CF73
MTRDVWENRGMLAETRSPWRFYPLAFAGAMFLVFLVNAGMVWTALTTFPGAAAENGFDESNVYNAVMADAARQKALGWRVGVAMHNGRAEIALSDRAGHALSGATVSAEAYRPLGPKNTTALSFLPAGDGHYLAGSEFPAPGQWDIALRIARGDQMVRLTRRLVAP